MVKRADGRWQEKITYNGKAKYFYGKTRAEAKQKANEFLRKQAEGVTFRAVGEEWQGIHREDIGEKTWINYKPHYESIMAKHGDTPVKEICALDVINDLRMCAAQKRSATIISTRRSLYRMILDHALLEGHIKHNPAIGVPIPKGVVRNTREAPDEEIFEIIMRNINQPFGLFPALLACTGLRKAEALALTWGDIGEKEITVNKALDYTVHAHPVLKLPKTKAGIRTVPIIDALKFFLVRPKRALDSDLVFPAVKSNRSPNAKGYMTERQYQGAWRRYCEAAGLLGDDGKPIITAHQLRHGLATMGFEAGVDELTMQRLMGHASPNTTRRIYTHLREKKMNTSIKALNKKVSKMMSATAKPNKTKPL